MYVIYGCCHRFYSVPNTFMYSVCGPTGLSKNSLDCVVYFFPNCNWSIQERIKKNKKLEILYSMHLWC